MLAWILWAVCWAAVWVAPSHAGPLEEAKSELQAGTAAERRGDLAQARIHLSRACELSATVPDATWPQAACAEALGLLEGRLGQRRG